MLGVLICYLMLQMVLLENVDKEQADDCQKEKRTCESKAEQRQKRFCRDKAC